MSQLKDSIEELKEIIEQFGQEVKVLRKNIQGLTELTSIILEGAMGEIMEEEGVGEVEQLMPLVRASRTGPN